MCVYITATEESLNTRSNHPHQLEHVLLKPSYIELYYDFHRTPASNNVHPIIILSVSHVAMVISEHKEIVAYCARACGSWLSSQQSVQHGLNHLSAALRSIEIKYFLERCTSFAMCQEAEALFKTTLWGTIPDGQQMGRVVQEEISSGVCCCYWGNRLHIRRSM